jgi:hypothetical protein
LENLQIMSFVLEGRGEGSGGIDTRLNLPTRDVYDDAYRCELLNKRIEEIVLDLEKELRNIMPLASGMSVQADMSFRPGSIVLEGSVTLLCWAGRIALEPVKEELANLILHPFVEFSLA